MEQRTRAVPRRPGKRMSTGGNAQLDRRTSLGRALGGGIYKDSNDSTRQKRKSFFFGPSSAATRPHCLPTAHWRLAPRRSQQSGIPAHRLGVDLCQPTRFNLFLCRTIGRPAPTVMTITDSNETSMGQVRTTVLACSTAARAGCSQARTS